MRLAWVSPLPPMQSGIADYSYELLPLVAERADVDAVTFRPRSLKPRKKIPRGIPAVDHRRFAQRADGYDAVFYHLGNNPAHKFVYELSLEHPGIGVFHEYVMHHLIAFMTVEWEKDLALYQRLMREEYGEAGDRLVKLRLDHVASDFEKFMFPLTRHVARRAKAIVVHNADSRDRIVAVAPDVPVFVIPHHAQPCPPELANVSREDARTRLGLAQDAFVVGHFGFITRPKQPAAVLGGFAMLAAKHPNAQLVMIGADNTGGGMDRQIAKLGIEGRVKMAGFVDLTRFYLYLKSVDAVINLRYPSAGESSGTFARALAEGRPAIVNNLGSFAEIPADVALKVEIDGDQTEQVGAHLIRLAEDDELRLHVEERARSYAATVLDPKRCRDLYLEAARAVGDATVAASSQVAVSS